MTFVFSHGGMIPMPYKIYKGLSLNKLLTSSFINFKHKVTQALYFLNLDFTVNVNSQYNIVTSVSF